MRTTEQKRKEYFQKYYLKHKEDYQRRSKEFRERRKLGIEAEDDEHYYHSIEELKQAEERHEGKINWDVWDKLVEETKLMLQEINDIPRNTRKTNTKPRYVYDTNNGRLLYKDIDINIAAELAMTLEQIRTYCNSMKYIKYKNLLFANEFIPTWHVKYLTNKKQ